MVVSYETARLANEMGFTGVVGLLRGNHYYNYKGELDGDQLDYLRAKVRKEDVEPFRNIAAPLQSELQKWLRDIGMYVLLEETETYSLRTGIGFYYKIIKVDAKTLEHYRLVYSMYFYSTYEEALEEGLKEALQLI